MRLRELFAGAALALTVLRIVQALHNPNSQANTAVQANEVQPWQYWERPAAHSTCGPVQEEAIAAMRQEMWDMRRGSQVRVGVALRPTAAV